MSVDYIGNGNDDGTNFGQSATDKIGFYGLTTPIVQPILTAAVSTAAVSLAGYGYPTSAIAEHVVEAVNLIMTRLKALGLMA
uniref:Uncharacterized protein n=1 Tax=viral metagenome TaxID=1070528 RepID=A0A6H1ZE94_9ZZZZ